MFRDLNVTSFQTVESNFDKLLELSKIISYTKIIPQKEVFNMTVIFKVIDSREMHRIKTAGE